MNARPTKLGVFGSAVAVGAAATALLLITIHLGTAVLKAADPTTQRKKV